MSADQRLVKLGWTLPPLHPPLGRNLPFRFAGNVLYIGGSGPRHADGSFVIGKVGRDLSTEQAYEAARLTGLNLLAKLKEALTSLDRVEYALNLVGLVNAVDGYLEHPLVVNGVTDVLIDVFGDAGLSTRVGYGVSGLALNMPIEVSGVFMIRS